MVAHLINLHQLFLTATDQKPFCGAWGGAWRCPWARHHSPAQGLAGGLPIRRTEDTAARPPTIQRPSITQRPFLLCSHAGGARRP